MALWIYTILFSSMLVWIRQPRRSKRIWATFQKPEGIVQQTVCKKTGCLATTGCTETYTEIFTSNNLPEKCQGHGTQTICEETGKLANEYCPTKKETNFGGTVPKEQLNLWKPVNGKPTGSGEKVEETCDIHKKPEEKPVEPVKPAESEKPKQNTTAKIIRSHPKYRI